MNPYLPNYNNRKDKERRKKLLKSYVIHYELPPMRAMFHREVRATSEQEAVDLLKEQIQMVIKIRKIEER
jgi:hypothetical protein